MQGRASGRMEQSTGAQTLLRDEIGRAENKKTSTPRVEVISPNGRAVPADFIALWLNI